MKYYAMVCKGVEKIFVENGGLENEDNDFVIKLIAGALRPNGQQCCFRPYIKRGKRPSKFVVILSVHFYVWYHPQTFYKSKSLIRYSACFLDNFAFLNSFAVMEFLCKATIDCAIGNGRETTRPCLQGPADLTRVP